MRKTTTFALALATGVLALTPSAFAQQRVLSVQPDITMNEVDEGVSSTADETTPVKIERPNATIVNRPLTAAERQLLTSKGVRLTSAQLGQLSSGSLPTPPANQPRTFSESDNSAHAKIARYFAWHKKGGQGGPEGTPDGSGGPANEQCVFWYTPVAMFDPVTGQAYDADGNEISIPLTDDGRRIITGTEGDDVLCGDDDPLNTGDRSEVFYGLGGNDRIEAGDGNDQLYGGAGDDALYGQSGHDSLWGGDGDDSLFGGQDNDHAWGGNGNDKIWGGGGNDRLWGEAGGDFLNGGHAVAGGKRDGLLTRDWLDCGTDHDSYVAQFIVDKVHWCDANIGNAGLGPGTAAAPGFNLGRLIRSAAAVIVSGGAVIACVAPSVAATVGAAHISKHAAIKVGVLTIPPSVVGCTKVGAWIYGRIA